MRVSSPPPRAGNPEELEAAYWLLLACLRTHGRRRQRRVRPDGEPDTRRRTHLRQVFAVQCGAIVIGHMVLMWKLRRMVAENHRSFRWAMADPRLEQRARRFVADVKAREERERSQGGGGGGENLSLKARFRR